MSDVKDASPDLLKAAQDVLVWWNEKINTTLASNADFPWAEDAEWGEFHALRKALSAARGESI